MRQRGNWLPDYMATRAHYVQRPGVGFPEYFKRFYGPPRLKVSYHLWSRSDFDAVLRFETLNRDFKAALEQLGVEPVRDLPVANKPPGKREFLSYYTPEITPLAVAVFGPFMRYWDYELPSEWNDVPIPTAYRLAFNAVNRLGEFAVRTRLTPGFDRLKRAAPPPRLANRRRSATRYQGLSETAGPTFPRAASQGAPAYRSSGDSVSCARRSVHKSANIPPEYPKMRGTGQESRWQTIRMCSNRTRWPRCRARHPKARCWAASRVISQTLLYPST